MKEINKQLEHRKGGRGPERIANGSQETKSGKYCQTKNAKNEIKHEERNINYKAGRRPTGQKKNFWQFMEPTRARSKMATADDRYKGRNQIRSSVAKTLQLETETMGRDFCLGKRTQPHAVEHPVKQKGWCPRDKSVSPRAHHKRCRGEI